MPLNIVFMGTPDFAVPCLRRLHDDGHNIRGVFCQPDRPKGRGHKLQPPPVKQLALELCLPVHQPTKLRDGAAEALLRELAPDLVVVVAYGRLLPDALLQIPPLGTINVHASLLPHLRGAAPIQWSIIRGDTTTGVTTMHVVSELDAGDIILVRETPISDMETAGELFERLAAMGADLLGETVPLLEAGTAPRMPQDPALVTLAPPITKDMGRIDFTKSAREISCLVRGLSPSPGAFAMLGEDRVKIHVAVPVDAHGDPGAIIERKPLTVACGEGALELRTVQPPGKKPMDGAAYLLGRRDAEGRFR